MRSTTHGTNNVVVVAATGNDGSSAPQFPAGDRGVIGVSNTDQLDSLNASSNYGADTFLAAPGTEILTTTPSNGYASVTGTSAAAAIVAGAAGLLRATSVGASNGVIVSRLAKNADAAGTATQTGNGRLNLGRAAMDTSSDSVEPAGAAPVGGGGPFVGPYVNYTITQPTTTADITPKNLTVAGITASNRPYDGTTTATLNTASAALVGVVAGDTATVTLNTAGAVGTFANKNVGNGKTVTVAGITLSGAAAGNYTLASTLATTTAAITAVTLTPTVTAATKIYDGTTAATARPAH